MKKNLLSALLVFTMFTVLVLSGCSSKPSDEAEDTAQATETEKTEEKEQRVFAASYFTVNNVHFIEWGEGLKEIIEANGDKLIELDAQLDINKQISDIEDVLQQDVDAIFVAPVDSEGIETAYLSCEKAGVPVINIDVPIADDLAEHCAFQVTTDNVMAGRVLGEGMVEETGGEAKVALIDWSINKAVTDRTQGFEEAIADYPGIEIVARQDASASVESAIPVMETMLQAHPEITAVFGINDPTCEGALSAIEAANAKGIGIYSIDGSPDGLQLVKEGKFVGTSVQFPRKMGNVAAETAYKFLNGEEVEKVTQVESVFATKDNVDEYLE